MMLLTVSHGLLFNNSLCGEDRQSLPNRTGNAPAPKFRARPRRYGVGLNMSFALWRRWSLLS
jgi:hypothetical protein